MQPTIKLTFPSPTNGYWDGGLKSGGEFKPECFGAILPPYHPGVGALIKWGCFYLNFRFNAGSGRSWKEARAIAKRRLASLCRVPGAVIE